jgi:DNA-binding CsgD family transcriptional regulator
VNADVIVDEAMDAGQSIFTREDSRRLGHRACPSADAVPVRCPPPRSSRPLAAVVKCLVEPAATTAYRACMEPLSTRDVDRALSIIAAAASSANGEPFGVATVDAVMDSIPADAVAYIEWRFGSTDCVRISRGKEGEEIEDFDEALDACCDSYPLRDVEWAGSPEPLRISDVVSQRAFRCSPFYSLIAKPSGIEHELKLWLPAPPGHARFLELARGPGPNFVERDRSLLALIRPHLATVRARWELRARVKGLTERELEVLQLVAEGLTNRKIARRLFISPATVRTHLEHVFEKLGVRSRTAAVRAAFIQEESAVSVI